MPAYKKTNQKIYIDPVSNIDLLKSIFPELTGVQVQTIILYSCGLTRGEIASLRNISIPAVDKSLTTCRNRFELSSLSQLRAVVNARLLINLMK